MRETWNMNEASTKEAILKAGPLGHWGDERRLLCKSELKVKSCSFIPNCPTVNSAKVSSIESSRSAKTVQPHNLLVKGKLVPLDRSTPLFTCCQIPFQPAVPSQLTMVSAPCLEPQRRLPRPPQEEAKGRISWVLFSHQGIKGRLPQARCPHLTRLGW